MLLRALLATLGWLLLASALAKGADRGREYVAPADAALVAEAAFGAWLLTGRAPRVSRVAAALLFGLFASVACYRAVTGASSCGCFGRIEVPPIYTLALDLAAVGGLIALRPTVPDAATRRLQIGHDASAAFVACLVGAIVYVTAALLHASFAHGIDPALIMRPDIQIGQRLPVFDGIGAGSELETGEWTLVFYRRGCDSCRPVVTAYRRVAEQPGADVADLRVALIAVPAALGEPPPASESGAGNCVRTNLRSDRLWLIETPLVLRLRDGLVVGIVTDPLTAAAAALTPGG